MTRTPSSSAVCGQSMAGMSLQLLLMFVAVVDVVSYVVPEFPTARIVVHVRKRRAQHWDYWQINSNVCPPSLCPATGENSPNPAPRPRGTGGSVFYQGDIVLDEEVDRYIHPPPNNTRYRRATVRLRNRLWKDGEVPYAFAKGISSQAKRVIERAFKHISQRSCITFREKDKNDTDFIRFISEPGCWSAIGKSGGRQLLSLGRGCENLGTAVHEIFHALGVWHEQARKDRDTFVRVIEENISERFMKDFEKVDSRVSTSRGFPYDYTSVMHYSRFAFTKNGKPTIEVRGVGKELGMTLRQRHGLSTIDMAQLRDMYRCNIHTDTNQTECPEGWFKHEVSCYKFFEHPRRQFAAAAKDCDKVNSHLVFIESQREDNFLARQLLKKFPNVYVWRTGGRMKNGTMKWYREDSTPEELDYTNWAEGQPSSFSSVALQRDRRTNVTQWHGVWAGSLSQLPYFAYSFICERRARRKCLKLRYKDGRDYRGQLDHTIDGYTCQKWTEQYPHQHNLTTPLPDTGRRSDDRTAGVQEDRDGLGDHNYCRNPRKERRSRPWCYTAKKTRQWQLCDVWACAGARDPGSSERQAPTTRKPPRETQSTYPRRQQPSRRTGEGTPSSSSGSRTRGPASDVSGNRRQSSASSGNHRQSSVNYGGNRRQSTIRSRRRRRHLRKKNRSSRKDKRSNENRRRRKTRRSRNVRRKKDDVVSNTNT